MKPRFLFGTKRRLLGTLTVGAVGLLAVGAPLASAAFRTQTTSTQQVATGTYRWAISGGGSPSSGPAALYPGTPPQVFDFVVTDTGTLDERFLRSDLTTAITSQVAGCSSSDFLLTTDTHGATGTTLSPGGHVTVTVSVALNTTLTDNACENTVPTVTLTISGRD